MTTHPLPSLLDQLALIARASLPLPEGLRQLAATVGRRRWRRTIAAMAVQVEQGVPLAVAMRDYPQLFPALYIDMVALGEQHGILGDLVGEAARFAGQQSELAGRIRHRLYYPLIAISFAIVVFGFVLALIVPRMVEVTRDLSNGEPLALTLALVDGLSRLLVLTWPLLPVSLLTVAAVAIWMLASQGTGLRLLLWAIQSVPGGRSMVFAADQSRLCAVLGAYTRHGIPLQTALRQASLTMTSRHFRGATLAWAAAIERGEPLAQAIASEPVLDPVIATALCHAAEAELPAQLERLVQNFRHRTEQACEALVMWWSATAIAAMFAFTAAILFMMFVPLIEIMRALTEVYR